MSDVTAPDSGDLVLAAEFPAATRQQWRSLVAKVLKSTSDTPEAELATITSDGIEIAPLYVADVGQQSAGLQSNGQQSNGQQGGGGRTDPGYPGQAPFVRGRTAAGHRSGWDVRQRH